MIAGRYQIGVIGSAGPEEYLGRKPSRNAYMIAEELGNLIARKGWIVICGGKGGIMESVCKGAKSQKGLTVGVVSGNNRRTCNSYVDVEVVSGMINCGEESLIISMSDVLIILGGGAGTLQEIATAYRNKKPMICINGLDGWGKKLSNKYLDYRKLVKVESVKTPQDSIDWILNNLL